MIKASVDVDGIPKVQARMTAMQARGLTFQPVFSRARDQLERANRANFASSGFLVGGWQRRKDAYSWPLMRRTGRLFNSLANLRGPANVITPKYAQFGTNVDYAKFHQYGTRDMPKRAILFNPRRFGEEVASDAASWVVRGDFL